MSDCGCNNGNLTILKGDKGDTGAAGSFSGELVITSGSGATVTLTVSQSGQTILLDRGSGIAITLPTVASADAIGTFFDFQVYVSMIGPSTYTITSFAATELFTGYIMMSAAAADDTLFSPNGTTHDTFTMNGSTQGGLIGTTFRVTCIAVNTWFFSGQVRGSGVVVTPFST